MDKAELDRLRAEGMMLVRWNSYQADLAAPIFVRLLNCESALDFLRFADRYGLSEINDLAGLARGLRRSMLDPAAALDVLNGLLPLRGRLRLARSEMVLEASDLREFMALEVGLAYEAGAKLRVCVHCGDVFLYGHATGRRRHARYCADRCRSAAMRARKRGRDLSVPAPDGRAEGEG
jgi:hypothetical protein